MTEKVQLVARNVHRMRLERGYSQGELARRAGLSKQTMLSGRARIGPVGEQVEVARGDFVWFPGDVPHSVAPLTQEAVVHMVTTVPHVSQFGGREG